MNVVVYANTLIALLLSALFVTAQKVDTPYFDKRQQVEQWIKDYHVPALGIGLLQDGALREIRMYGELKKGVVAPANALFNVASLTKPVVALLTLKLINNGNWNLDEPLYRYWVDPDIANDPRHKKLTTRLVLSHQTGFKNWRYLNTNNKLAFDVDPGTKFGYSGEGFEYLRKALESKFRQPLEKLTDSLLFKPLKMYDTRFKWDRSIEEARFAHWYDTAGNEHQQDYKKTIANAADDLITTIEDYGKLAVYVLQGAGVDTALYNQMVHPQVPTNGGRYMSLGWEMFLDLGAKKEYALTHSGSDAGVRSLIILLPDSKQGLVIFTNSDNGYKLYEKIIIEMLDVGKELMSRVK